MTLTALVLCSPGEDIAAVAHELDAAGFHMLGAVQGGDLVREAARHAPDVVVGIAPRPDAGLFEALEALQAGAPCPVIVFTAAADAPCIERAVACGVHAYVVDDARPRQLRSLFQLARARFAHERALREALREAQSRFEERKWVDRAKGVLMRARKLPEDDAFRLLRSASMHSSRRVGEVARQVVDSARDAEVLNRAGQLRMLSQRVVKLYALVAANAAPTPNRSRLEASSARIEDNLRLLESRLPRDAWGDLLDALRAQCDALRAALVEPPVVSALPALDACAEALLQHAERLSAQLRTGSPEGLRVIDLAGRQRMLSQRVAKLALLGDLLGEEGDAATIARQALSEVRQAFETALGTLQSLPLRNAEIATALHEAAGGWRELVEALPRVRTLAGRCALGEASESVLAVFERLTASYETSMQVLMG